MDTELQRRYNLLEGAFEEECYHRARAEEMKRDLRSRLEKCQADLACAIRALRAEATMEDVERVDELIKKQGLTRLC